MNKIILIGNLTSQPELKGTPSGQNVCTFGLAVNERRGGQDLTQFFRISVWGKLGENCQTYLDKGKKVFVAGPLTARTYNKSDGSTGVSLEVMANDVEFLSARTEAPAYPAQAPKPYPPSAPMPVETDELPF